MEVHGVLVAPVITALMSPLSPLSRLEVNLECNWGLSTHELPRLEFGTLSPKR